VAARGGFGLEAPTDCHFNRQRLYRALLRGHYRRQVGWRDEDAETLAPDDHALIFPQINAI
jgi:hypothetical protein